MIFSLDIYVFYVNWCKWRTLCSCFLEALWMEIMDLFKCLIENFLVVWDLKDMLASFWLFDVSWVSLDFRVACYSKMSTTLGPLCRKFVPVEQSEVTSISNTDGVCISCYSFSLIFIVVWVFFAFFEVHLMELNRHWLPSYLILQASNSALYLIIFWHRWIDILLLVLLVKICSKLLVSFVFVI